MNPNITARRLVLLATTIHVMGAAIATVSSSSFPVEGGRSFLRSSRGKSIDNTNNTGNNNRDKIRRLVFKEKDNLFDETELQNDSDEGIGASGIIETSTNTDIDEAQDAAAPQTPISEAPREEINPDNAGASLEAKTEVEVDVETENSLPTSFEPDTSAENQNESVRTNTDASDSTRVGTNDDNQAKDPEIDERTAEDEVEEKKIMNVYVFSILVAAFVFLYLLYWRDNLIHQRIEHIQKQQEQRDRLKNIQLRASLQTESLSLDGSFTNAGVTLSEEIRFSTSPVNSPVGPPKTITTASKAIDMIRKSGKTRGDKKQIKDRDTQTDKTMLYEIGDMDDDDDDDNCELSSSRRTKTARRNLSTEEHWVKYSTSMRSNKGDDLKATSHTV